MRAMWNDVVVAESDATVIVEGNHYFLADSIVRAHFIESAKTSVCPWKGTASYFSIEVDGSTNVDAAWYYPSAKAEAEQIEGYIAFWRGVQVIA